MIITRRIKKYFCPYLGLVDTAAVKTAETGYMQRRLVDNLVYHVLL